MSDKESTSPWEDIQKQVQDALRSGHAPPGMGAMRPEATAGESPPPADDSNDDESEETLRRIREFNLKPREIRDHLNRFVIQQEAAKKVLSVAICDHYNHVRQCLEDPDLIERDYQKQNIILLGPTGVGKTYIMRCIARLIGVPMVKADATKFSETGYVGYDAEDLVRDLVKLAGGNHELAQYGIIYIDEIDKIASTEKSGGRDVSGRGVQVNLLKLMEDAEVNLFSPTDMMAQMQAVMEMTRGGKARKKTINTRHILFIVSGAFDELGESVKKRMLANQIGFSTTARDDDRDPAEFLHHVDTADFINYGYEPEFIGRLPVRVACEHLRSEDLARILTSSEGSLLEQYRLDFKGYGVDFKITPEAIQEVANRAHLEKTGARGLMTVLERIFRDFKFELPSTAVKQFEVTTETVAEPQSTLKQLLLDNQQGQREVLKSEIEQFAERFGNEHGIRLAFSDDACDVLIDASVEQDKSIRALCEERFRDFQHGLKIIARNSGQESFRIEGAMARNPDKELSRLVVESFQNHADKDGDEPEPQPGPPR